MSPKMNVRIVLTLGFARRDRQCRTAVDGRIDGLIEKSPRPVNSTAAACRPDAGSRGLVSCCSRKGQAYFPRQNAVSYFLLQTGALQSRNLDGLVRHTTYDRH